MKETFEQYLQEAFMNQREIGGIAITKDNYENMFDNWIEDMDKQEMIDYADAYANGCYDEAMKENK